MKILSIDTTSQLGSIALSEDDKLIAMEVQGVAGTHSERLVLSIEHLMSIAKWEKNDIEGIVCAMGPGSFTGLRIGLGTAKGIALAIDCPIVGVSSLASLALNAESFKGTVVALIDARRGELYASAYKRMKDGKFKNVMKECVLSPDALIKKLKKITGELTLVGDGAIAYRETLAKALKKRALIPGGSACYPQAINLATLALPRFKKGKTDDLALLAPNYIRVSDAEIGFKGKRG